jgi:hypothetical protein
VRGCSDLSDIYVRGYRLGLNSEMKSTYTSRGQDGFPYCTVKNIKREQVTRYTHTYMCVCIYIYIYIYIYIHGRRNLQKGEKTFRYSLKGLNSHCYVKTDHQIKVKMCNHIL